MHALDLGRVHHVDLFNLTGEGGPLPWGRPTTPKKRLSDWGVGCLGGSVTLVPLSVAVSGQPPWLVLLALPYLMPPGMNGPRPFSLAYPVQIAVPFSEAS